jgi:hypothetical protein
MSRKKKAKVIPPTPKLEEVCANIPDSIKGVKLARAIKGLQYKEVTIAHFCELMADEEKNRKEIAQFVYDRFHQRYLLPFEKVPSTVNSGFAQMAICCLMIEAMESFQNGWGDTQEIYDDKGNKIGGGKIFENFFNRYKEFEDFRGLGSKFYSNVRCGILHQAESKNGWRIGRTGALFDKVNWTINSTIFLRRMKTALRVYCDELKSGKETVWNSFKTKMVYVILNCKTESIGKSIAAFPLVGGV